MPQINFWFYLLTSLGVALVFNFSWQQQKHADPTCGLHCPKFGPLQRQEQLTLEDILDPKEPMLVHSPNFVDAFRKEAFGNLREFQQRFGEEILYFVGDGLNLKNPRRILNMTVNTYLEDHMMDTDAEGSSLRLSESGGRAFFLARPALYENIAKAFAKLVPESFRGSLDVGPDDHQRLLEDWAANPEVGALALWTGYESYGYSLHIDILPVTLLSQLVGRKRVFLYPPEQFQYLYMKQSRWEKYNWEYTSLLDLEWDDRTHKLGLEGSEDKYPLFQNASPLIIDLNPGDTLFIPCGWAHFIVYTTAGISVSAVTAPNGTPGKRNFTPLQCTDFYK